MPSELLQGDKETSCGMVNGSFFKGSRTSPTRYSDPSLGSGKNTGKIASVIFEGTWTMGSATNTFEMTVLRNHIT